MRRGGRSSLRFSPKAPIVVRIPEHSWKGSWSVNQRVIESVVASLKHAHDNVLVFRETSCDHKARSATTDDDEVIVVLEEVLGRSA